MKAEALVLPSPDNPELSIKKRAKEARQRLMTREALNRIHREKSVYKPKKGLISDLFDLLSFVLKRGGEKC
jgi:hypothetical protein